MTKDHEKIVENVLKELRKYQEVLHSVEDTLDIIEDEVDKE